MRVHPLLLQQVLLLVVHATSGVHQLGEVLQLVLLELLAWVGGAWRGRKVQRLGSGLGLSQCWRSSRPPEDTECALNHSQV